MQGSAVQPLAPETMAALHKVSTDTITGMLMKIAGMRARAIRDVRPIDPRNCHFVGTAFTVRYVPIREDYTDRASPVSPGSKLHGRLDEIPAGSVVVLDMGGDTTSGALGDVIIARLIALGVVGVVADGGMRDGSVIATMSLPVWARAAAPPPSPRSLLCAGMQEVIGCGGVMVEAGDVVVADGNGVAVIPRHLADEVAHKGLEQEEVEVWIKAQITSGARLSGLYPPTDDVIARWKRERGQ
jgi:regulator of RNase E activity RraA